MALSLSYVEDFKKILQSRKYDEYTEGDFHKMISKFSNSELDDVAKTACTYVRGRALDVILSTLISNKVKEDPATELLIRAIQQGCTHEGPILKILLRHGADVNKAVEMQIGGRPMTLTALEAATKQEDVKLKTWLQEWRRLEVGSADSEVREKETQGQEYDCVGCKEKDRTIGKMGETIREQNKKIRELETSLSKAGTTTQLSLDKPHFPDQCLQEENDSQPWSHQNGCMDNNIRSHPHSESLDKPHFPDQCSQEENDSQPWSHQNGCMDNNIRSHPHSEGTTVCAQQERITGGDSEYVCGQSSWTEYK